ncbi:MAG: hypothetical protein K2Q20_02025, partial [Phycisphaerales bacterium]|nr:hypothetical protein [Phycisphaerales bacterium]
VVKNGKRRELTPMERILGPRRKGVEGTAVGDVWRLKLSGVAFAASVKSVTRCSKSGRPVVHVKLEFVEGAGIEGSRDQGIEGEAGGSAGARCLVPGASTERAAGHSGSGSEGASA